MPDFAMVKGVPFVIDFKTTFQHLARAPIVEAVIHWQARAAKEWFPDTLQKTLSERLPDYPKISPQHLLEFAVEARVGDAETPPTTSNRKSWQGFRLESVAKPYVAQFTIDGLVFSRLQPYENWEMFSTEACRLWRIFVELAAPTGIQRLGVRFINRINSATCHNLKNYLNESPSFTSDFELNSFIYRSTFDVPGHAFEIGIVKTMQPVVAGMTEESGLIIDIDVFTNNPLTCEEGVLDEYLPKMRWLKNKVFFNLLKPEAIKEFE